MFDKSYFSKIINFMINVFLAIGLCFTGLYLTENLNFITFIQSCVVSMGVGYLICDLIPAPIWGQQLAVKLGLKNKILCRLLTSAVGALVLITSISFFCQFVSVGNMLFIVWPNVLPYLWIIGFLIIFIFMPLCEKIAAVLTR